VIRILQISHIFAQLAVPVLDNRGYDLLGGWVGQQFAADERTSDKMSHVGDSDVLPLHYTIHYYASAGQNGARRTAARFLTEQLVQTAQRTGETIVESAFARTEVELRKSSALQNAWQRESLFRSRPRSEISRVFYFSGERSPVGSLIFVLCSILHRVLKTMFFS